MADFSLSFHPLKEKSDIQVHFYLPSEMKRNHFNVDVLNSNTIFSKDALFHF